MTTSYEQRARSCLRAADKVSADSIRNAGTEAMLNALTGVGYALLALVERAEDIDDVLRNTIGGQPR